MTIKKTEAMSSSKPGNYPEEDAFLGIARTHEYLMQGFVDLFRRYDLTPTQYNLLRILRGAGAEGLNCSEAGRRMINHDPDITRLFDRLELSGLLSRQRSQDDRRVVKAFLSEKGGQLLANLDAPVRQLHEKQMSSLDHAALENLIRLLERLRSC